MMIQRRGSHPGGLGIDLGDFFRITCPFLVSPKFAAYRL